MIMLGQIAAVSVYVRDLESALTFYTDQLGFERRSSGPRDSEARSITVAPAGGQTEVILIAPPVAGAAQRMKPEGKIGSFTGIVFSTDDIGRDYDDLAHRGVDFPNPPKQEAWGTWAQFADPDGNTSLLVQRAPAPVLVRSTRF